MSNLEIVPEAGPSTQATVCLSDEDSVGLYLCTLCKKSFYSANALQNHTNSQHDIEDFHDMDDQISSQLIRLQDEATVHLSDEDSVAFHLCTLCKKSFYSANALQNHNNMQHDIEDFNDVEHQISPQLISLQDEDANNLVENAKDKDLDAGGVVKKSPRTKKKEPVYFSGPFVCSFPPTVGPDMQCRQSFVDCCDYSLHYHEKHTKHRKRGDLKCQVCEKQLAIEKDSDNSVLFFEVQLHTNKPMKIYCQYCGKMFTKCSEYNEHISKEHVKPKPYQCATCSKCFIHKRGLQLHMGIHAGIRPFSCTYCPKTFTQKSGLTQHLRTHSKIKPFECVICKKRFLNLMHLRQHMRTHTNIQPFKCVVCERRFKQSSHLNYHMHKHITDNSSPLLKQNTQAMPNDILLDFM